jgi:type I restriction enzyme S subunit
MNNGWEIKSVGEVCDVVNGGTPRTGVSKYWNGSHLWITPAEMGKRLSPYVGETGRKLTDFGLQDSSAQMLPPHSIILSSRAPIGHLVINTKPMSTNQGCKGLVPSKQLEYKFLYYYLTSIVDLLDSLGTGATFRELSTGKLKEVPIPIPLLSEQKRIVALLDRAFESIAIAKANTEKNLSNVKAMAQPVFTAVFDSFNKGEWHTSKVENLAMPDKGSIKTGPFGSQLLHSEFVESGIPVLGIDNAVQNRFAWNERRFISQHKFLQLSRYQVKPGDVLITIMGTCGRCAIVPDDIPVTINSKHLCCITLDKRKCLPEFLHGYFLYHPVAQNFLAERAIGSIMTGLNMGIIKELPVVVPPITQQQAIVTTFAKAYELMGGLARVYQQKLLALENLKQSILQQAFTGKL